MMHQVPAREGGSNDMLLIQLVPLWCNPPDGPVKKAKRVTAIPLLVSNMSYSV